MKMGESTDDVSNVAFREEFLENKRATLLDNERVAPFCNVRLWRTL